MDIGLEQAVLAPIADAHTGDQDGAIRPPARCCFPCNPVVRSMRAAAGKQAAGWSAIARRLR